MMSTAGAAAAATSSNYRFQKNDNIFVKIGKESHPATFIEYYNSNDKEARIRFSASSAVAMVKLNQLELMEKTTKRRHTPKILKQNILLLILLLLLLLRMTLVQQLKSVEKLLLQSLVLLKSLLLL